MAVCLCKETFIAIEGNRGWEMSKEQNLSRIGGWNGAGDMSRNGEDVLFNKVMPLPKDDENRNDQIFVAFYKSKKTDFHQIMPVLPSF